MLQCAPVYGTPPPPPQIYVITAGDFIGVTMNYADPASIRGLLALPVPLELNPDLEVAGVITRQPGEAQSAFFTGAIGNVELKRVPALDLYDQNWTEIHTSDAIDLLFQAEIRPLREAGNLLRGALNDLQRAEASEFYDEVAVNERVLALIYEAQVRVYVARDLQAQLTRRPKQRTRAKLRAAIGSARRAAQRVFAALVQRGLDLGYDVVLLDDKSYPSLAWNTETGKFSGYCPNPGPVYGIGSVETTTHGYRLSAQSKDLRIEASVDTISQSGAATIKTVAGDTLCTIIDADYTR